MSKIHQIGDEYYIEFYARGLLYQQKAGKDLKKAQELLRSIEEKIAKGELQVISREIDLDIFFDDFLNHARPQYHPATVRRLQSTVENFTGFIRAHCPQVKQLSQVTPRVIEDYKNYGIKKRKGSTGKWNPKVINLTLILLREILEYGIKTGFINDNPTLHVRLLKTETPATPVPSEGQLAACLEAVNQPFKDALLLMRYTGLRAAELADLSARQVDLNRQVIFIRLREIPLMPQAREILNNLLDKGVDYKAALITQSSGAAIEPKELKDVFEKACVSLGLPSVSLAGLRHAFVTDLLQKRVSFLSIGKMLGVGDVAKLMLFSSCLSFDRKDIQF